MIMPRSHPCCPAVNVMHRSKGPLADARPALELFGHPHHVTVELGGEEGAQAHSRGGVKHALVEIVDDPGSLFLKRRGEFDV